jgi:hypothetical protein
MQPVLAVLLLAAASAAATPAPPAAPDNPVLGSWSWAAKDGSCKETHEYRADGTATIRSGEEVLEKTYTIEKYKGGAFYLLRATVTASNGGKDCTGGTTPVGKASGAFILPSNDGNYYTCSSDEGWGCYGSATKRND